MVWQSEGKAGKNPIFPIYVASEFGYFFSNAFSFHGYWCLWTSTLRCYSYVHPASRPSRSTTTVVLLVRNWDSEPVQLAHIILWWLHQRSMLNVFRVSGGGREFDENPGEVVNRKSRSGRWEIERWESNSKVAQSPHWGHRAGASRRCVLEPFRCPFKINLRAVGKKVNHMRQNLKHDNSID